MKPVHIIGIDNMNDYYDVSIKEYRLQQIENQVQKHSDSSWNFVKGSIADKALIDQIFADYKPAVVVNLAAQAGVRYSITNPDVYIESKLSFILILNTSFTSNTSRQQQCSTHLFRILLHIFRYLRSGSNKTHIPS